MMTISTKEFEEIVANSIDQIPPKYAKHIKNLAFVVEDEPTEDQRLRLHLHNGQTLYGLYEGIPITQRSAGYNLVLPDKITIFKGPIERSCITSAQLLALVKETVWHEVAHYFGLDHFAMRELKKRSNRNGPREREKPE